MLDFDKISNIAPMFCLDHEKAAEAFAIDPLEIHACEFLFRF